MRTMPSFTMPSFTTPSFTMPSLTVLPLLLLLVVSSHSSPLNQASEAPMPKEGATMLTVPAGNANEMLDQILNSAKPELEKNNEIKLPEATFAFSKKIMWVKVEGEAKMYDGWLNGLMSLYRAGDATMESSEDGSTITITASLGLKDMTGHYRCHAKFMGLGPNAEIGLKVSVIEIKIQILTNFATQVKSLKYFDISRVGDIDLSFDGLGPLDWIINPLGGYIINLVKTKIVDAVEGPLRGIIAKKLQEVDLPVG